MPISFTVVVRNGDRHRIGTAVQGSRGDWAPLVVENPVAPEEADHAQVEGSSAAPFARTEPASDRSQLWHFPAHALSRRTDAFSASRDFSASRVAWARPSWKNPRAALKARRTAITPASMYLPRTISRTNRSFQHPGDRRPELNQQPAQRMQSRVGHCVWTELFEPTTDFLAR